MTDLTPDLQQAIHAATEALRSYPAFAANTETTARVAVEAAWPRSALAELAVLRHSNSQMRDLTRQQDTALTETREQLHAAQAEVERYRAEVSWMRTALLHADPRHEEAIREALNQQATPRQDDQ